MLTTHEWVYRPTTQRFVLKVVFVDRHWVFPVTRLDYEFSHKLFIVFFLASRIAFGPFHFRL
jgi:hypothetical protein